VVGPVLAGPLLGVAWWLLAPTAAVEVVGGAPGGEPLVVAPDLPELEAAQDGTLLLLLAAAGLVTGLLVAWRGGARPTAATLLAGLGALMGAVLAAAVGQLLGPDSLAAQGATTEGATAEGGGAALVSPLVLHAVGVVLVWPIVTTAVATVGHVAVVRSQRGSAHPPAPDRAT